MKVKSVIFSSMNGSIADMTLSKWKDKKVARTKPTEVSNPKTEAQTKNRDKFALINLVARALSAVFVIGLRKISTGMTEYNKFVSLNTANDSMSYANNEWSVDYANIDVAQGSATPAVLGDVTAAGQLATVEFVEFSGTPAPVDSVGYFAAVSPTGQLVGLVQAPLSTAEWSITIPTGITPANCFFYWFYINSATGQACDSQALQI